MRFIRSSITAVTVLALTAAVAMAHEMPSASVDGLATAAAAAGKIVPVGHVVADENEVQLDELTDEQTTEDELTEETEETEETDETEASEGESHCIAPETEDTTEDTTDTSTDESATDESATDESTDETSDESEPNHGAIVCGAAQAETPDGYPNHGAYVREFAQDNNGAEKSAAAKAKHSSGDAGATSNAKGHGHNR